MFRIRIDAINHLNIDDIIQVCEPSVHVTVRHELPNGNPHYHMYVATEVKEQTIRQRIKRKYADLKPSDYSVKKCNQERINEYVQYMFNTKHGNRWELYDSLNFDNQLLNTLQKNAQDISTEYDNRFKQSKTNRNKPTIYELAQEIKTIYDTRYEQQLMIDGFEMYKYLLEISIDTCHKHHQPFEEHYLRKLVTTVITMNDRGKTAIIRKIMLKEFPNIYT